MRDAINAWLSIILKLVVIGIIVLFGAWLGFAVYANVVENNAVGDIPKMPDMSKADIILRIQTTGELLLVDDYEVSTSKYNPDRLVYSLNDGHYELINDKWKWREKPLVLDESFWGKITVIRRIE